MVVINASAATASACTASMFCWRNAWSASTAAAARLRAAGRAGELIVAGHDGQDAFQRLRLAGGLELQVDQAGGIGEGGSRPVGDAAAALDLVDAQRDLGQHADRGLDGSPSRRCRDVGRGESRADGRGQDLALRCGVDQPLTDRRHHEGDACGRIAEGQQWCCEGHGQDAHAEHEQERRAAHRGRV